MRLWEVYWWMSQLIRKVAFVKNSLVPSTLCYSFPYPVHREDSKDEKWCVSQSLLNKLKWLVLSNSRRGLYCKYCALLMTGTMGRYHKNVPLEKLVAKSLMSFAKLLGNDYLPVHEANKYHQEVQIRKDLLPCVCAPEKDEANQICVRHLHQMNRYQNRWFPIIKSNIFLGCQNKNAPWVVKWVLIEFEWQFLLNSVISSIE